MPINLDVAAIEAYLAAAAALGREPDPGEWHEITTVRAVVADLLAPAAIVRVALGV